MKHSIEIDSIVHQPHESCRQVVAQIDGPRSVMYPSHRVVESDIREVLKRTNRTQYKFNNR